MRERLLHVLLFTPIAHERWGLPALLWGEPGTGKSAIIEGYARRWGLHCEVLSPGERGEGAFGVTPVPGKDLASITYPAPDWTDKVAGGGVVFVDELNLAPPALQAPMLGLIQARRIGSHQLHPRCRVLGAANPVDMSAGGWDLAPPVANRMGHWDWDSPSADDWTIWLLSGANDGAEKGGDADEEEERVLKAWPAPFARASGLIAGFVRRRAELLHKMPAAGSPDLSRAWPSRRTWEAATRALASSEVHGVGEADSEMLVAAFVGKGAADELCKWKATADLPDPADVLDGKVKFKLDTRRLDRTLAVYASCAALVAPPGAAKRKERASALWKLMAEAVSEAMDVTVPAATVLVKAGLLTAEGARPVLAKLEPVLAAAGMR
jgi:hypothetical protein